MDDHAEVAKAYEICRSQMLGEFVDAFDRDDFEYADQATRMVDINDHAYFCLLFFQLEHYIKSSFDALRQRRASGRIASKRAGHPKLDLIAMAEILLGGETSVLDRLRRLYEDRNAIANDGALTLKIEMDSALVDIQGIRTRIQDFLSFLEAAP